MKHVIKTLLMAAAVCTIEAAQTTPASRPNILFIMVDEMRWDAMSCANHPIVKTPNLDNLARGGTRFAATYTCAPVCVPSRYSFFTSRYGHVHGSLGNATPTHPGELFLPAILRHQGYQTAISGKLHFLPSGQDHGFDSFRSYGHEGPGKLQNWPDFLAQKHGPQARQLLDQPYPNDPLGRDIGRLSYPKEDMQSFWITDRAVDFLHQRDQEKPFFLFVSYLDPHSPSHLAEPYWSMFDPKKMPAPKIPDEAKKTRAEALKAGASGPGPARSFVDSEAMVQFLTATYFAKIALVDDNVGRLLKEVDKLGLDKNTIIVFTADHGNMLGDRGRWFKGVMYEGSSRIPLLIKAPVASPLAGSFNQGKTLPEIVENIDVMPTLMEMSGAALPPDPGFQGKSLVNLVAGKDPHWKNVARAELGPKMIRTPQYKLIKTGATYELYDMIQDPKEERDLAGDPAQAKTLAELKEKMDTWQQENPPAPVMEGVEKSQATDSVPKKKRKAKK
jgi:choline-sulfatase